MYTIDLTETTVKKGDIVVINKSDLSVNNISRDKYFIIMAIVENDVLVLPLTLSPRFRKDFIINLNKYTTCFPMFDELRYVSIDIVDHVVKSCSINQESSKVFDLLSANCMFCLSNRQSEKVKQIDIDKLIKMRTDYFTFYKEKNNRYIESEQRKLSKTISSLEQLYSAYKMGMVLNMPIVKSTDYFGVSQKIITDLRKRYGIVARENIYNYDYCIKVEDTVYHFANLFIEPSDTDISITTLYEDYISYVTLFDKEPLSETDFKLNLLKIGGFSLNSNGNKLCFKSTNSDWDAIQNILE